MYIIEKDKYLNKYVLWERHGRLLIDVCHGYKYQCEKMKKKLEKKTKR